MIIDTNNICTSYGLFILFGAGTLLTKIHPDLILIIKAVIIVDNNFDCCGRIDNAFYFCKFCYTMIIEKKILKFRSVNYINVLSYQKCFGIFNNLTLIKKVFIACIYPVMFVIKLRSNKTGLSALLYYQI